MPSDLISDYYGNKRPGGGWNLLGLLFEDLFKIFNKDLKRQADMVLSGRIERKRSTWSRRSGPDTISNGMINAIATGNALDFAWTVAGVTQVSTRLSHVRVR
jgi:DNA-directed RNA polymerase III subunit RPC2